MFITPEQFVRDAIPSIVMGREQLVAIFTTYNAVGRYKSGPVETGRSGLAVTVRNGNMVLDPMALALLDTSVRMGPTREGIMFGMMGQNIDQDNATRAQMSVEREVAGDIQELASANAQLVVVYAGLNAFEQAVSFAQETRGKFPEAVIVVLTCDCKETEKREMFEPLLRDGAINHVVLTYECGGRGGMSQMLDGLVAAWPVS